MRAASLVSAAFRKTFEPRSQDTRSNRRPAQEAVDDVMRLYGDDTSLVRAWAKCCVATGHLWYGPGIGPRWGWST